MVQSSAQLTSSTWQVQLNLIAQDTACHGAHILRRQGAGDGGHEMGYPGTYNIGDVEIHVYIYIHNYVCVYIYIKYRCIIQFLHIYVMSYSQ